MIQWPSTETMPFRPDAAGVTHIGSTRVTLDSVVTAFRAGATAEEIVQQYPSLQLADVYHVIGYYLGHASEVNAYLEQRLAERAKIREINEHNFDPNGVRARLMARRSGGAS